MSIALVLFLLSERCWHVEGLSRTTQRAPTGSFETSAWGWKLTETATLNACEIPRCADFSQKPRENRVPPAEISWALCMKCTIFCWPPAMNTERLWFCIEWKQNNTTKYTEVDSVERWQLILFFYIWMATVDDEIRKKDTRGLEEV